MDANNPKIIVLILAGGNGFRIGRGNVLPKQLMLINNKPIIAYCLDIYQEIAMVDSIVLVINNSYRAEFEAIVNKYSYSKVINIIPGGVTRQESISNGLSSINQCDVVIIQNGTSIFTPRELIMKCVEKSKTHGAVSAFAKTEYSSFLKSDNYISKMIPRENLCCVRDPQVFNFNLLQKLHQDSKKDQATFTNDVALAKDYGHDVFLIESSAANFKITTAHDLAIAKHLIKNGD